MAQMKPAISRAIAVVTTTFRLTGSSKTAPAAAQPNPRLPSNVANVLRQCLKTIVQLPADACLNAVGPGSFDQGSPRLRHGKIYSGVRTWTQAYRRWLTTVRFDHPAQQIVLQDYIEAVTDAEQRVGRLTRQITELIPDGSMAPVATAIQAMRGMAVINAVTVVAEVGDFARFGNPRQLMAYLGLVPSEHSSGSRVRRGGITKAGNVLGAP
jgi:transposase